MAKFDFNDLKHFSTQQIVAAGPRYSPNIDANAPNLAISSLLRSINALASNKDYHALIQEFRTGIADAVSDSGRTVEPLFRSKKRTPAVCISLLDKLAGQKPGKSGPTLRQLRQNIRSIDSIIRTRRRRLINSHGKAKPGSRRAGSIDVELSDLRKLDDSISALVEFVDSPALALIDNNCLLIRGSWGTGKTHSLCDIVKIRMAEGLPTLFALGHRVQADIDPLLSICTVTGFARTPIALLRRLSKLAKAAGGRALIVVDGVNEGDKRGWFQHAPAVIKLVRLFPDVGLVLSCRTPFEPQTFDERARKLFVDIIHRGFEGVEYDAQQEFFRFYGIPGSHIPLLAPEFSRPLFLKVLCQTFSGQTASAKSHWIRDLMAGQKTMTKLLEDFVTQVGAPIEREFELTGKTCWFILKGKKVKATGAIVGIAPHMAANLRDYLSPMDCISIIVDAVGLSENDAARLFYRLIGDGLLVEDLMYEDGGEKHIIRLPYQRFSDHLICRHLLENYLDVKSKQSVRQSLQKNRPLGKLFAGGEFINSYSMPGWATAVILEFPERTKRVLADDERELLFQLPRSNRLLSPFIDPFLEGLTWRHADSFSNATDQITGQLLEHGDGYVRNQTFEVLVGIASRTGHPYSAKRLSRYLSSQSLTVRDLRWSEFIRQAPRESSVRRLIEWTINHASKNLTDAAARNLLLLLSTFLTTTHRAFRDRTTRALVALGQFHPECLFDLTSLSFAHNDPYVPERLLAASYGVMMRKWAQGDTQFQTVSTAFARRLFDNMFEVNAQYATSHILMRDYALGVIELVRRGKPKALGKRPISRLHSTIENITTRIPDGASIEEEACKAADPALGMDFRNYTVGRLVRDRRNYDFDNSEYQDVMRQLRWRMLDLGYSAKLFEQIDQLIGATNYRMGRADDGTKVDRYGKKYAWIAFFEVAGLRDAMGKLKDATEPRISDCDVDPTFSIEPQTWSPPLYPYFTQKLLSAASWAKGGPAPSYEHLLLCDEVDGVAGPWVLLHGNVHESAISDPRQISTFLRSKLAKNEDLDFLRSEYSKGETDGHHDLGQDHYDYLGEVPWSTKHGWYLRDKRGRARRQMKELFGKTQHSSVRRKASSVEGILDWATLLADLKPLLDAEAGKKPVVSMKKEDAAAVPRYIEVPQYRHIPGIQVEIPAFHFAWESYHSTENDRPNPDFVAPAISQAFGLRGWSGNSDLVDTEGRQATIFRLLSGNGVTGRALYLRRDLLEKYLHQTGQEIVWRNTGERSFHYKYLEAHRKEFKNEWELHKYEHLVVGIPNM